MDIGTITFLIIAAMATLLVLEEPPPMPSMTRTVFQALSG